MPVKSFKQAKDFLSQHIPKTSTQIFPGESGLKRTKYFLKLLNNPQEKLKIVHVAGTSGKGSTCCLISSLLESQGFKVGFHQSPHLTDVRERFQIYTERSRSINNRIIGEKELVFFLNKIIPIIDTVTKTFPDPLTYFEILVGLAFLIFYEKKVDYAVMETGLGGRFDATNIVERPDKLAVFTKIGLDHTNILGKTIEEIAYQKAMIINKNSRVVSTGQELPVKKIFEKVVKENGAVISFAGPLSFDYPLNLIGDYQRENAGLALAAVNLLSKRDGSLVDQIQIVKVFNEVWFPGRFDIRKINGKTVIFDGAHNPQKMEAFIGSLIKKYPGQKFSFLLAFKKGKDYRKMLNIIVPRADSIILTCFLTGDQDMVNASEKPETISRQLKNTGFSNFKINPSFKKAWEEIIRMNEPIVVVGSLYLIGEIFRLIKRNKNVRIIK